MSDLLIVSGLTLSVNDPLPLSVPLSDSSLIFPSDLPLDGEGDFVGVFNGDGTNVDPDDGVVVFDVFHDISLRDKDGTTDDCLPADFFFVVFLLLLLVCSYLVVCVFFLTFSL